MALYKYQTTPNPDSFKITRKRGQFIKTGLLSFSNPIEASSHQLAQQLFSIAGVTNILILPDFITVSKEPHTDWEPMWKQVETELEAFYNTDLL